MPSILFWNFKYDRPDKESIPARLALHHGVDILILAESEADPEGVLSVMNSAKDEYRIPSSLKGRVPKERNKTGEDRFQIFTRFPDEQFRHISASKRTSVWGLHCPGRCEVLLALIHFHSKRSYPGRNPFEGQFEDSQVEYLTIHEAETDAGHMRTMVIGDFNMNPYEKGMIHPGGFGAMMCRSVAEFHSSSDPNSEPGDRRFYNPTWSRMGRDLPEPPGSFYWDEADTMNVYWHSLDQVLIRPALLAGFRDKDFEILASMPTDQGDNTTKLVRFKDKHWKLNYSDHLPLLLKLDLPEKESHDA